MKPTGGYTVVEVMIVLAVSGVLLFSAITVFNGKQSSTQFTQAMQDVASKIQSYATQTTSGSVPDISGYKCQVGGIISPRPTFSSGSGSSEQCIFMGRALLVRPDSSTISAYAVVGARNNSSGNPAETFDQANVTTARLGNNNLFLDTYNLGSLKIVSSTVNGTTDYGLVGLYTDLAGTSAPDTSNSSDLLTYGYPFKSDDPNYVRKCVEGNNGEWGECKKPTANFSSWKLCLQDGGGPTGQINITATGSSLNAQVKIPDCS